MGDATQHSLREIWNGAAYQDFRAALLSDAPPAGLRRLRPAMEPVTRRATPPSAAMVAAVIPCLDEEAAIGAVVAAVLRATAWPR